jgi:hypothetical protein
LDYAQLMMDEMDSIENDSEYSKTVIVINVSAVCIIDDDELFEMWLSIEADRIAR